MLLIFPIAYIVSFIISLWGVYKKRGEDLFVFVIIGLPIYNSSLSIAYSYHLKDWIPFLQSFKELLILFALATLIWNYKKKVSFHTLDYWIAGFLIYTAVYIILPLGHYSIIEKLVAIKSLSFFTIIYFTGRCIDTDKINFKNIFYSVGILTIAAALLLIIEVLTYTHFQSISGFTAFNTEFFGLDSGGNYNLGWTFERENGFKRFASFFANPLEFSTSMLVTVSMVLSMYTQSNNSLKPNKFGWIVMAATFFSVIMALSRASLLSYTLLIYCYALLTKRKEIQYFIYLMLLLAVAYLLYLMKDSNIYDYIINVIQLNDSSSIGHLLEWVEGVESIIAHPLGIGLGESGKVAAALQNNVGGENQLIIVGVQTGIISLIIYITIYIMIIKNAMQYYSVVFGKLKTLTLTLVLMKIAFIFPMLTSNFDSNSYISFLIWLLTGIWISMIQKEIEIKNAHAAIL